MLAPMIRHKEVPMSEQGQLFAAPKPAWITKVWDRCDPRVRPRCIAILAEMGRVAPTRSAGVRGKPPPTTTGTEETDGSRREATDER